MPTYEYKCHHCSEKLEISQKISAAPLKTCPNCNVDALQRGPGGGIGLSFTGSGFYITDYTQHGSPATPKGSCCPCNKSDKG